MGRQPRAVPRIKYRDLASEATGESRAPHLAGFERRHSYPRSGRPEPVVVCGAPGVPLWTPEELVAKAGDLTVPVSLVNEELGETRTEKRLMRVAEYVELLRSQIEERRCGQSGRSGGGGAFTPYAKQVADLFEAMPELKEELEFVMFDQRRTFVSEYLWIGAAGSVTGLHNDDEANFLMQLHGRKHVLLYPPRDGPKLYTNSRYDKGTVCSSADPYASPAAEAWPLLAEAEPWQCVLAPGEQLFIPRFWWHRCECVGLDLSISCNGFGSTAAELLREGSQRTVRGLAHWLGWKQGNCVCCDPVNGVQTLST